MTQATTPASRPIRFVLNGETREVSGALPTTTLLDYLRGPERLTGTKEGCAEGDCGACTVLLCEPDGEAGIARRSVNACIQFLPAMNGRAVETIEHLGRDGPTPLQVAMVENHASQCGFCTPGFVMQLHAAWLTGALTDRQSVKDVISGNLCRCTGYGPIVEAGLELIAEPVPDTAEADAALSTRLAELEGEGVFAYEFGDHRWFTPTDVDDLADTYAAHPEAVLVAGATDVGLWVTKQYRELPLVIDVSKVRDLMMIEERQDKVYVGASVTHRAAQKVLGSIHPDLGEMLRRFAGAQIRNAGTIGGNIANGSPIGDLPPCLIALGSRLFLRKGDDLRIVALEDFFVDYGRQDRAKGEFVAAIEVPRLADDQRFFAHKISKRFDSDISAVMAAFCLTFDGDVVRDARLAFGGMAGVPKRAKAAEAVLVGRPFNATAVGEAMAVIAEDFSPLTDMRATSRYRLKTAQNLLKRFQLEQAGDISGRIAVIGPDALDLEAIGGAA